MFAGALWSTAMLTARRQGSVMTAGREPRAAAWLGRYWFLIALCAGLGLALSVPAVFAPWVGLLEPRLTVAAALFLTAWTMPGRSLAGELRRPWPSAWAVVVSYGVVPALAWGLGAAAPLVDLRVGLLLVAAVPCTLASAVLWTRLAGGNEATALFTVLGTTLLSWLATTAWLTLTTGTLVDLPALPLMLDLALCLIVPVALGLLARLPPAAGRFAGRHKVGLGAVAQLFVLAIVLRAGVTVGARYRAGTTPLGPGLFAWSAALAVGLHLAALAFGLYSSRWLGFDRGRQIAVAISCSQKTLPVSLLLFDRYFDADFPLAVVPLLCYHAGQLLLDTLIANRLRHGEAREPREGAG
jgi:sodium/bile acid cotransporter 7